MLKRKKETKRKNLGPNSTTVAHKLGKSTTYSKTQT